MKSVLKNIGLAAVVIIFIIIGYFLAKADNNKPKLLKRQQIALGTVVEIQIRNTDEDLANKAISEAFDEISRIDTLFSAYTAYSPVWKINQSPDSSVKVQLEIFYLMLQCDSIWKITNGAFDVSIEELVRVWKFDTNEPEIPSAADLEKALRSTGWKNILLNDSNEVIKKNSIKLNFGAVIPGYAADRALKMLKVNGIKEALVNAGGEIKGIGSNWVIGVQHPRRTFELAGKIELAGMAVSTSGDYEQYFEEGGKRYHHIFDPATGYPASGCMSVTVLAKDGIWADALSTGVFVMGPDKGMELIENLSNTEAMIIDSMGKVKVSSGFNKYLRR